MNKNKIKGQLNQEGIPPAKQKILFKCWDVALLWGCSNGVYLSQDDIARILKTTRKTIRTRLELFKKEFPEAYEKLSVDRASCKNTTARLNESIRNPLSWDDLKEIHGDEIENHIVEKY